MTPQEVWWLIEAHQEKNEEKGYAGTLTERDVTELAEFMRSKGAIE